ncbi:homoserine O-succinyltransferase [Peptoniphilus sp. AGMB00490]|uniref:Homoserine O-succinyltransferase n=2 Tax=Peptoniphilus TaxID=162289 RepID=A0ACD6AZS2_9FIRM|nr:MULTISPECIES: homoserine O-succinyltransferase [Peptoniphilus]NMW85288.1 homoserine O-succinyltransferase [Peptoniphilus faecalis]OLR65299.1 homoserine O-succinyltransferase [Peptoniphilus porci]
MPLIIPKDLIVEEVLERENIFTMRDSCASKQDIRPLNIAIVNLMPKKEETELQLLRMLSNTALQINIDLIRMESYNPSNSDIKRLKAFYKTYEDIKNNKYDAMIITGAPIETIAYEKIKYWEELKTIFEFAKENVYSTMFICWSAQAALYHYYNIEHKVSKEKIFGVFEFDKLKENKIIKGFDDTFLVPTSRHTYVDIEDFEDFPDLEVIAARPDTGVSLVTTKDERFVFNFGHWEYDKYTLHDEYIRDISKGKKINPPQNYYEDNDPKKEIKIRWKSAGNLFFSNWLNYCVYQETPFAIETIEGKSVSKFGGSSLKDAGQFAKVKKIIFSKEDRDVIVVSAPGRRFSSDTKITDELISLADKNLKIDELNKIIKSLEEELSVQRVYRDTQLKKIKKRFLSIAEDLKLEEFWKDELQFVFEEIENSVDKEFIVSRGEYLNAKLLSKYLNYSFVDAKDIIIFDNDGQVDLEKSRNAIKKHIGENKKVVVPGFYGSDNNGDIVTFTRGGSDYTGSLIAYALDSKVYENWTDVNGIMTSDPNQDPNAKTIDKLNFKELKEIIDKGAQVYQGDAIKPVEEKNITIKILNTNNPKNHGTIIKD